MSRRTQKAAETPPTVVYCGPTIPGAAKQFTVFRAGLPDTLAERIRAVPALGGLIVPLDRYPEAQRQLREGTGSISTLYRAAQGILTGGKEHVL